MTSRVNKEIIEEAFSAQFRKKAREARDEYAGWVVMQLPMIDDDWETFLNRIKTEARMCDLVLMDHKRSTGQCAAYYSFLFGVRQ